MDYFLLKQDERYINTPRLIDVFKKINLKYMNLIDGHKIEDFIVFNVKADEDSAFLDILDNQLFLLCEDIKKILEKYNSNILFKCIPLVDSMHNKDKNYFLPIFEEIQCLSETAELNLNKTVVKKIVLDKEKIKGKKIFKIKESSKPLIVIRLDVGESLLRRDFKGIKLERLEVK